MSRSSHQIAAARRRSSRQCRVPCIDIVTSPRPRVVGHDVQPQVIIQHKCLAPHAFADRCAKIKIAIVAVATMLSVRCRRRRSPAGRNTRRRRPSAASVLALQGNRVRVLSRSARMNNGRLPPPKDVLQIRSHRCPPRPPGDATTVRVIRQARGTQRDRMNNPHGVSRNQALPGSRAALTQLLLSPF